MGIEDKAKKLLEQNRVIHESNRFFTVIGDSGVEHFVFFGPKGNSCSCPWFAMKTTRCSHILACEMMMDGKSKRRDVQTR